MKKALFFSASLLFSAISFAQSASSSGDAKSVTTVDSKNINTTVNATSATNVSADARPAVDKANESLTTAKQRTKKAKKRAAQEVANSKRDLKQQFDNTKVDAGVNAQTNSEISSGSAAGTKTALRVNSRAVAAAPAVKTRAICIKPIRAGVSGNAGLNINK